MIKKNCAFTGHRPQNFPWGYDEADIRCMTLKKTLAKQIVKLVDDGYTDFFSGMAEGVDTWAALAVLTLKKENPVLKLHCVLPYEGQADKWSDPARELYHSILEQSDSVEYISRDYYDGCMLDRNCRLIKLAGLLLAVYSGTRRSGTGATVSYARKMDREIIVIDPITLLVIHEDPNSGLKHGDAQI